MKNEAVKNVYLDNRSEFLFNQCRTECSNKSLFSFVSVLSPFCQVQRLEAQNDPHQLFLTDVLLKLFRLSCIIHRLTKNMGKIGQLSLSV